MADMARIEVSTHIEAPASAVWAVLSDWERQAQWMVDARSVRVTSPQHEGVGVTLRCRTNILGVVVNDDLVVTEWEEESVIGVRHLGRLISGIGAWELTPTPYGTRLQWWEEADVPLGAFGDTLAGPLVVAWVTRVFRRSLAALKPLCEARAEAA